MLFNNKEIRIDGKPFSGRNGSRKVLERLKLFQIKMEMSSQFLFFSRNIHCKKTSLLHFYQVICAIPGHLLTKAKLTNDFSAEMINIEDPQSFHLDENVVIIFLRGKSKDFYWLTVDKKYKEQQTIAKRWNQTVSPMDKTNRLDKYIQIGTKDLQRKQSQGISF